MVLDKTGTITEGKPKVTDIMPFGVDEKELLIIAASIEKPSEHPLAEAILAKAKDNDLELVEVESFNAVPGRGITAIIDGKSYVAGNIEMMRDNSIKVPDSVNGNNLSQEGKTPLYFAKENTFIGVIAVADTVKESSKSAIKELKDMGIDVIMLTGDNETTAKAVAGSLQIDNVVADVMPQDKESIVRKLQEEGKKVAMVGDGINDAPALVRADVGIAIGAGTDIAIESADIVLMRSDLNDAVFAVKLGKATIKNIKQNLFWAFFYNTLGIPLAAGVFYPFFGLKLSPMIGALAMSLSSVFVVTNALRLRFFNRE
jgi:Cu+-exporting ATPase